MTDMKQLRELSDAATPGEWGESKLHGPSHVEVGDRLVAGTGGFQDGKEGTRLENEANGRLIVAAVNGIRSGSLVHVDEVGRLREALRRIDHLDETKTTFGSDLADAGQIARDALSQGEG